MVTLAPYWVIRRTARCEPPSLCWGWFNFLLNLQQPLPKAPQSINPPPPAPLSRPPSSPMADELIPALQKLWNEHQDMVLPKIIDLEGGDSTEELRKELDAYDRYVKEWEEEIFQCTQSTRQLSQLYLIPSLVRTERKGKENEKNVREGAKKCIYGDIFFSHVSGLVLSVLDNATDHILTRLPFAQARLAWTIWNLFLFILW